MTKEELKNRSKAFHIAVIKACEVLPKNAAGFELGKQLIRSAGSVGANYRQPAGQSPRLILSINWKLL